MAFNNMDSFIFGDYILLGCDAMLSGNELLMIRRSYMPPYSGWYKKTTLKTEAESFSETKQHGFIIQKVVIIISNTVQTAVTTLFGFF